MHIIPENEMFSIPAPSLRRETRHPEILLDVEGQKAAKIGKPGCWSALLPEKDLDQKGENHKRKLNLDRNQEGLWEERSHLCHCESPTGRILPLQKSSMTVTAPKLPLPLCKYFLLLCTCGSSCLHVPDCNSFFFLNKSFWWWNTWSHFISRWTLPSQGALL